MLKEKPGFYTMINHGFTIRDMLKELNIELNIPPFLDRCSQLPHEEIQAGRKIAFFQICV